jgi:AraC family transcriptional regulator, transcriptional activator of pobA
VPRSIPVYNLYGEPEAGFGADLLHCETLASRSRRHDFVIRPHRHATLFQLLYARSGPVEMSLEGSSFVIESPCLLAIPPLVIHGFRFDESIDGWIISVPEVKLALLLAAEPTLLGEINKVHILDARQINDAALDFESLLVRIADEFTDLGRGRWLAMQACLVLALVRLDRYAGAGRRDPDGPGARTLQHARRFRRQVEDWFCERRPLEDYARALAITPT